jgi:leucyl aminopeptidase (aminopeptidase T)
MTNTPREFCTVEGVEALKALAHEDRLAILEQLREKPQTAAVVARALGTSAQRVGYHIKKLEAAKLVRYVASGRKRWKEEKLFLAEARQYLVDPAFACDDPSVRQGLAGELEVRFRHARMEKTLDQGLAGVANRVVSEVLALKPGSRLMILGGPFTLELSDSILVAAEAAGAIAFQRSWGRSYIFSRLDAHTADELATQDLFPADLLDQVDAVCQLTSTIPQGAPPNEEQRAKLPHLLRAASEFQRKLRDSGVINLEVSVPSRRDFEGFGSSESGMDTYWRAIDQSPTIVASLRQRVSEALATGKEVRIRDDHGGDLTFTPGPRQESARQLAPSLPSGACSWLVEPGTANGTVTADYAMAGGKHHRLVKLTIQDGGITKLAGCESADELEKLIEVETGDVRSLAYVTIGLSPIGDRLTGKTSLDSIQRGIVTLAFGTNEYLGGSQSATLDLGFPLFKATLETDGKALIRAGNIEVDEPE